LALNFLPPDLEFPSFDFDCLPLTDLVAGRRRQPYACRNPALAAG
jgi:hypothetical protein